MYINCILDELSYIMPGDVLVTFWWRFVTSDVLWGDVLLLVTFSEVTFCVVTFCEVMFCEVSFCEVTFSEVMFCRGTKDLYRIGNKFLWYSCRKHLQESFINLYNFLTLLVYFGPYQRKISFFRYVRKFFKNNRPINSCFVFHLQNLSHQQTVEYLLLRCLNGLQHNHKNQDRFHLQKIKCKCKTFGTAEN